MQPQPRLAALLTVASLLAAAGLAHAIVVRHDRPAERFDQLGARYPAVVDLRLPGGAGTLIHPEWVLTAAHAVGGLRPGHRIGLDGGREASLAEVHVHPEGRAGHHDVALLRLAPPVTDVAPLPLYRGSGEEGALMVFVGRGGSGDGLSGPVRRDGRLRAATNRVERVGERHLEFAFDPPEKGTDLEGISGPGDSGGPALLEEGGRSFVAGVSSGQDSRAQGREGVYGVREYYMRVSAYLDWIDRTMAGERADATPDDRAAAARAFAAGDWPAAAAAYAGLAAATPGDGQLAFRHGFALLRAGRTAEALAPLRRAAELGFQAGMAHYLVAGAEVALGRREEAWSELERAVAAGFARGDLLAAAAELAPLRGDPRFAAIVQAAAENAEPCRHGDGYATLGFWEGDWEVWMGGRRIAESTVAPGEGGCLWTETYRQEGADARLTLYWHPGARTWRALYVDERGAIGEYAGEATAANEGGALVLRGPFWTRGQGEVDYRLRIAPGADGSVVVVGESRSANDAPWSGRYELAYRRRGAAPATAES